MGFFGNSTTMGLDLGATGFRAVELSWQGGRPTVERWAAAEFPAEVADWRTADTGELSKAIRAAVTARGLRGHWVAHSVSGEGVVPQYFNFPQLMPEDVAEAVRIEVETALPFRADKAQIAYVLFPELRMAQGKVRTHGLAIAADGAMVEGRLRAIRDARLEPFAVETDATACINALLATRPLAAEGTTALLNIGHRCSNLALLGGENTLLVRDVPWAGAHLSQSLADVFSVTLPEAESLKQKQWEDGPGSELGRRMPEVLRENASEFAGRLRDTIEYWKGERLVPGLAHLFLTGGGSQVHGLPEFLAEVLNVPVERWSPLSDSLRAPESECRPWTYRLSVAFGLALRRFEREKQ